MFTDTQCRTAKPREELCRLNDTDGLYLEVKPKSRIDPAFKNQNPIELFHLE